MIARHNRSSSVPARTTGLPLHAFAMSTLAASGAFGQTFTNLGTLDANHQFSQAVAVSGTGQHVAGNSGVGLFDQMRGFRWSQGSGLTDMGFAPEGDFYFALGISNDGNTLTGGYQAASGQGSAFRWTSGSGFQLLADLPEGGGTSASGISADAQFIAGTSYGAQSRAVRWNASGTPQDLGALPNASSSSASAISGDGTTVVGESDFVPFTWTEAGGMQALPTNEGGTVFAVNFDGSVAAGYDGAHAARWNNGALQVLPNLPGTNFATAFSVSGNGLITGGTSGGAGSSFYATIWSDSLGAVDLNTFLPTLGIDLTGWTLENCTAISSDGNTLVGYGTFNEEARAWVVTIPSPGTVSLLGLTGLLAARRRR